MLVVANSTGSSREDGSFDGVGVGYGNVKDEFVAGHAFDRRQPKSHQSCTYMGVYIHIYID